MRKAFCFVVRRKQWIIKLLQEKRADSESFKYERPLILLLTSFGADFLCSFSSIVLLTRCQLSSILILRKYHTIRDQLLGFVINVLYKLSMSYYYSINLRNDYTQINIQFKSYLYFFSIFISGMYIKAVTQPQYVIKNDEGKVSI